jgi:hypothetical protein
MAREIPIRNNAGEIVATALVDEADYPAVSRFKWQVNRRTGTDRRTAWVGGRPTNVQMHREIVGSTANDGTVVRHRNRNPLDNRRHNLLVLSDPNTRARALAAVGG